MYDLSQWLRNDLFTKHPTYSYSMYYESIVDKVDWILKNDIVATILTAKIEEMTFSEMD